MRRMVLAVLTFLILAGPAIAAVEIREVTSPGGIRAWLVEEHSIPFTALELRFDGGTSLDPADKRGVTLLMMALLEEGSGDLDARGFAEARDTLAAEFDFDAYDDAATVSARFLTENRDASVALLRRALTDPAFSAEAIGRVKGQITSIIRSNAQDPDTIAGLTYDRQAFGDHPYGASRYGSAESLAGLGRDDLIGAKAAVLARDRVYVSAVGDITADELGQLLDDLLGGLPATGAPMPPRAEYALTGGVTVIDLATPQSVVIFGQSGIRRDDPDFFAAYVLNQILGGSGFSARLMEEVREKRGLTYGISTYLAPKNLAEIWQGSFASANERVAEAIAVIREEWTRAATDGVTAEELEAAKTYLTGSFPLRFDGNGPIANMLVGLQSEGLPIDYVTKRNAYVETVTQEDVRRVAARLMRPGDLHFVVVGQPVGLVTTP